MTRDEIRRQILDAITEVAPEVDAEAIAPAKPLRRQVDLDSADWLDVLVGVHQKIGVEISDADAQRLSTLDLLVDHCVAALAGRGAA